MLASLVACPLGLPAPAGSSLVPANLTLSAKGCLEDANAGKNRCGAADGKNFEGATCTGSSGLGPCCSGAGWCGEGDDFCGASMQAAFSHSKDLCKPHLENAAQLAKHRNNLPTCTQDANAGNNKCGPGRGKQPGQSCSGSHGLGPCCSASGWCGDGDEFCGTSLQIDYSHGNNLCPEFRDLIQKNEVAAQQATCLSLEEVAQVWMDAVMPIHSGDAASMCVPAMAMAGGCAFKAAGCNDPNDPKFHATIECGTGKGIWQIRDELPDVKEQAQAVYNIYTSSNPDYGCLSDWCSQTDCSEPLAGIGQDKKTIERHRFCKGIWTAGSESYVSRIEEMGGIEGITAACKKAAGDRGIVGNGHKGSSHAGEEEINSYLKQQLGTIFQEAIAIEMSSKLVEAMALKGFDTLKKASDGLGKDSDKVREICEIARVDLEADLLKEWLDAASK